MFNIRKKTSNIIFILLIVLGIVGLTIIIKKNLVNNSVKNQSQTGPNTPNGSQQLGPQEWEPAGEQLSKDELIQAINYNYQDWEIEGKRTYEWYSVQPSYRNNIEREYVFRNKKRGIVLEEKKINFSESEWESVLGKLMCKVKKVRNNSISAFNSD